MSSARNPGDAVRSRPRVVLGDLAGVRARVPGAVARRAQLDGVRESPVGRRPLLLVDPLAHGRRIGRIRRTEIDQQHADPAGGDLRVTGRSLVCRLSFSISL